MNVEKGIVITPVEDKHGVRLQCRFVRNGVYNKGNLFVDMDEIKSNGKLKTLIDAYLAMNKVDKIVHGPK